MTPTPRGLAVRAGRFLPRPVKRRLGRALGVWTRSTVLSELDALARGSGPIVAGPWVGEVGFELLYWVPFLAWVAEHFEIAPERLVVISRGGTHDWYTHVSGGYHDVFDQLSADEFRARNTARAHALGEQKQVAVTELDRMLLAPVLADRGCGMDRVLHPSVMYRLFQCYWWGHVGLDWVERHSRYRRLPPPGAFEVLARLPRDYVAVKFYYNDSFPATADNRRLAREVLAALHDRGAVVSLSTGLALDDHEGWEEEGSLVAHGIRDHLAPATNLALQSAIVAGARAWVGTYGGFAYLAPFHGVPSTAYVSHAGAFSRRHLSLAQRVFARLAPEPLLELREA